MQTGRGPAGGRGRAPGRAVSQPAAGWPGSLRAGGALLLGLLISLAIFGAAPLLQDATVTRPRALPQPVDLYLPPPPPPPPPETQPEPPKPPPPEAVRPLAISQPRLQPVTIKAPIPQLALNPQITLGPAIAPPGPVRFQMSEVDSLPMATARIPPIYPYSAKRRGIQGQVAVRFLVDARGRVSHLRITSSQPPGIFDEAVMRALGRWRFRPGIKDGRPVDTWVSTTIKFKLER